MTRSVSFGAQRLQTILEKVNSSFSLAVGASRLPSLKVAEVVTCLRDSQPLGRRGSFDLEGKTPGEFVVIEAQGLTHRLRRRAGRRGGCSRSSLLPLAAWARPEGPRGLPAPLALAARTALAPTVTFGV